MIVLNLKKEDIKFTKHKNGNHYATIVVEKRKELNKFENTHTVYNGQTATERVEKRKELNKFENTHTVYNGQTATERAEKAKKEYCGNGKEYVWEAKKEFVNQQEMEDNDLPDFLK